MTEDYTFSTYFVYQEVHILIPKNKRFYDVNRNRKEGESGEGYPLKRGMICQRLPWQSGHMLCLVINGAERAAEPPSNALP